MNGRKGLGTDFGASPKVLVKYERGGGKATRGNGGAERTKKRAEGGGKTGFVKKGPPLQVRGPLQYDGAHRRKGGGAPLSNEKPLPCDKLGSIVDEIEKRKRGERGGGSPSGTEQGESRSSKHRKEIEHANARNTQKGGANERNYMKKEGPLRA